MFSWKENIPHYCDARHVVVDVETSGLFPQRGARILEIGAIAVEHGRIVGEFVSLVNCGITVPKRIQRIHGITDDMLRGQRPPEEILPEFLRFAGAGVLIAHNLKFDMRFLRYEFSRLGIAFMKNGVCTLKMSKKLFPHLLNYRLETVARHLLGELPDGLRLHRALADAKVTAMMWMEMMKR